jgi:AraC-like DNA-binding protein
MKDITEILIPGASLLLAYLLFLNIQKVNIKANKWLGAFILCLFFLNINIIAIQLKNDFLNKIIELSCLIIAPVFFLSVTYFINPTKKWRKRDYFHFSLVYIYIFLTLLAIATNPPKAQDAIDMNTIDTLSIILNFLFAFQVSMYCYLSYQKTIKHQKSIKLFSSTIESVDLKWLTNITLGVAFLGVYWAFGFLIPDDNNFYNTTLVLISLFIIFYITYFSLKQKEIYPFSKKEKKELKTIIIESFAPEENKKKIIEDEKLESIKAKLIKLMYTEKPFLECELSLIKLASQLNISSHQLSYVINTGFNENFYQFVNRYRIEEAKNLLIDPNMNHLNLIGIAFEVGFNSKTVFNTTFKKTTNQTPSEYKKLQYQQQQ